jgi:hypothetical protein
MKTGNFWVSREVQKYWGRNIDWDLSKVLGGNFHKISLGAETVSLYCQGKSQCYYSGILMPFLAVVFVALSFVLILIFLPKNKLTVSMTVFSVLAAAIPLTTQNMESYYRYILMAPSYSILLPILLSNRLGPKHSQTALVGLAFVQAAMLVLFSLGYWIT